MLGSLGTSLALSCTDPVVSYLPGHQTLVSDCEITTDWPRWAARHHGYTGALSVQRALIKLPSGEMAVTPPAKRGGDVLMARLREGRANTARGAAHFLRETVGRVRYCGARGQLTVRADSGFYTHAVVAVCRRMDVRFLHPHPPARPPAESHRGDTRRCLDADSLLVDGAADWPRPPTPHCRGGRRAGTAHRPG